ncbi:MAG: WYL domain-containing protein [Nocardioides sp.]
MSASETERLLNLLIMLLVQRHFVSKGRIREILYADAPSTEAFEKTFERDKEELRSLGVPIEVGQMDAYFDDEPGYRVRADAFALPEVNLEPDEASVVALATRVWEHARLAEATTDAVGKLAAAGLELDLEALEIAQPRLTADEPSFDVFWEATLTRRPVTFDYRRPGYPAPLTRHLEPWGVVRFSGRWYVVGQDVDRGEERVFRLSRVVGPARMTGQPGSFVVPPGTDVREATRRLGPGVPAEEAVVLVRPGTAAVLPTYRSGRRA